MSTHPGPTEDTAAGPALIQFWCKWTEGYVPPSVQVEAPAWDRFEATVRKRLARTPRGPQAWAAPPPPKLNADSEAALRVQVEERLPVLVDPGGVDFASHFPLLKDHSGAVLSWHVDMALRGDEFHATGWVDEQHADALRSSTGVSPRVHTVEARIEDWPIRHLRITRSKFIELSVVTTPARDDTSLLVAALPGVQVWSPPEGERFTRYEPAARFRFVTDAGEELIRQRAEARAEAIGT